MSPLIFASVLIAALFVQCTFAALPFSFGQRVGVPFEFGITPKNFNFTQVRPDGTIDVAAALQEYGSSYCSSGGSGLAQYGTGPFCQDNCDKCTCNQNGDGSYTWCGYPYQCAGYTWGMSDLQYGDADQQPGVPFEITETFNNTLNVSQSFTFSKQESYSNSYSWTFETTVSDSMSVEVSAEIPDVCSVKDSFTATISVTSSNTQTQTHDSQWSVDQNFNVPPMTAVKATMTITTATFTVPYTANIRFQGYGYTWCNDRVDDHYCWFIPASNFLNFGGCYSSDGEDAICPFAGTFYGVQGVDAAVSITQIN